LKTAVVIVNWNSGPHLGDCLAGLRRQTLSPDRILVVDNASTDGSRQAAEGQGDVELVRLSSNAGFAVANNEAAARAADAEYLALLNPDAVPEPGWLEALVAAARDHPQCASFASRLVSASDPSLLDGAGDVLHESGLAWRRGHGESAAGAPEAGEVFSVCAAAALYRRAAFVEAGGFDPSFFCFFEDVDLGFRLRLRGHGCRYVPAALVRHVGSASLGRASDFNIYHGHRNLVWAYFKNMPSSLLWRSLLQHVALNLATLALFSARGRARVIWRAKLAALRGLPRVLRERRRVQAGRTSTPAELREALARGMLVPYRLHWRWLRNGRSGLAGARTA